MDNSLLGNFLGTQDAKQTGFEGKQICVDLDSLHNRDDNRPINQDKVKELAESIKNDCLGHPIVVRRSKQGGFEIVSGQHRTEAYRLLRKEDPEKYKEIPAVEYRFDDEQARRMMLKTNLDVNPLTKEEREAALNEIFDQAVELRKENKEEYKGVKTSQIAADILEEETGVKVSQATMERARKSCKKPNSEKIDNKREFVQQKLTSQWQAEQLHATDLKDDVLKGVSKLEKETQKQIADVVLNMNPHSKAESKHMTESALKIKNDELDKLVEKGEKNMQQYFCDLTLAKDLGEDITEALLGLKTAIEFKLRELGDDAYAEA